MHKLDKQSGYSLIEISIVIIIIGTLIAAIIAGLNLIKQATLRSVISDMQVYSASYNNFINRFSKVPGDIDTAYLFWGSACAVSAVNCNGNNDGIITRSNSSISNDEVHKAWNHLFNSKMISAAIQPVSSVVTSLNGNAPASKLTGAGYIMVGGSAAAPFTSNSNALFLGMPTASDTLTTGALKGIEAFSIDLKVDDGGYDTTSSSNSIGAVTGSWQAVDGSGSTMGACVVNTTVGIYNVSNNTSSCRIGLILNS